MTQTVFHSKVEVPGDRCDVCHRELSTWKAMSTLADFTLNYCEECLQKNAEPMWLIAATLGVKHINGTNSNINDKYITYKEAIAIIDELGEE